jgi:hypothetical protein
MFEGEKTYVFWFGLVILAIASVSLFGIIWFDALAASRPYSLGISLESQVPFIVAAFVFILIELYMMKSGVKKPKQIEP